MALTRVRKLATDGKLVNAEELMDAVKTIHDIFWATKNRQVDWYLAG